MDQPTYNADGSLDIFYGPERPEGAENWLRTIPERGFFTILRLYGPDQPYFDQTWRPDDVVRIT
jgi:hypothetical protein